MERKPRNFGTNLFSPNLLLSIRGAHERFPIQTFNVVIFEFIHLTNMHFAIFMDHALSRFCASVFLVLAVSVKREKSASAHLRQYCILLYVTNSSSTSAAIQ